MSPTADLLITRARVFTADPAQPLAEAVATQGGRILFVGSAGQAEAFRRPGTRVIDAAGRTLLPGFIDSHFHLLWGALELGDIQLVECATLAEMSSAVRTHASRDLAAPWLVGQGLRYNILGDGAPLTRQHLDASVADRPLIIFAYDHHTGWANTEALRRARLLQDGRTVAPNSEIVLGPDGLASGELRENGAYDPVRALIPVPDAARRRALLHQGLAQAAQLGLTSVHNMNGDAAEVDLYAALEDAGELTLRVYVPYSATPETPIEALAEAVRWREQFAGDPAASPSGEGLVRAGAVKFFMDGVIESYTALVLEPYADRPGYLGDANFSAEHFTRMAVEADRLGLQIFVHAIGDAAVRRTLDGFEAAQRANGRSPGALRHRIEHIELIHADDLARFAQLGVVASMQPLHAPSSSADADVWPARVGPARWGRSFAWQALRQAGARLAFGSDWPVVSANPLRGIHAALNRQAWAPGLPDHRQTLAEALLAYTRDAAYAEFQEDLKGQLRAGLLADMVLLSDDIFAVPPEAIAEVHPILTVCAGRIVYEA